MFMLCIENLDLTETFETLELAMDRFAALEGSVARSHRFTVEHPCALDDEGNTVYVEAVDLAPDSDCFKNESYQAAARVYYPS